MICTRCKTDKPPSDFYRDKNRPSGLTPRCKPCFKLYMNRERRREYEKEYREANPERRAAIVKKSMSGNSAHHSEQRRKYLKTEGGIAMYRKQTQKRYALKKAAFVEDVDVFEMYQQQQGICYLCQEKFEFNQMHADHVIPLSKRGLHERSNMKMACAPCNLSKGAKMPSEVIYPLV